MKSLLVSACLLGTPCRYDGQSKPCPAVLTLKDRYRLVPICPEVMGGLPTPRVPSEIQGDRVMMKNGTDVTQNYRMGAEQSLSKARENQCEIAILKAKSPSCGKGLVYDGSFQGILTEGHGVCAALLLQNGIRVYTEAELETKEVLLP